MFANNICTNEVYEWKMSHLSTFFKLKILSKGVSINFEAMNLWLMSATSWMLNDIAIVNFGRILTFDHENIECLFVITDLINMSSILFWGDMEDDPNLCSLDCCSMDYTWTLKDKRPLTSKRMKLALPMNILQFSARTTLLPWTFLNSQRYNISIPCFWIELYPNTQSL